MGSVGAAAQTDVSTLVDRASAYVEAFQQNFGSVVSEERYEQRLRRVPNPTHTAVQQRGGGGPQETTLVSDFLLVEVKGEGWLPFRDVFARDGRPVRDREERLATIFLKGDRNAFDQARAIVNEGARYNIGNTLLVPGPSCLVLGPCFGPWADEAEHRDSGREAGMIEP